MEAVASKIVPKFAAKAGEQEKPQADLQGSYVQEPKPEPDVQNEKSGRNRDGEWEVVHRPGVAFELPSISSPPAEVEVEALAKIKPIRLTLEGEGGVVKGVKFYLDEVELTDLQVEPLIGTGQGGLWTVEIPRPSRDLVTLRIS